MDQVDLNHRQLPPADQRIHISDIISIYVALNNINPRPTSETFTQVITNLESVILNFSEGFGVSKK